MPSLQTNLEFWDKTFDWKYAGDEWSLPWGGVDMHWYSSILPRIQKYLPAQRILEIGPGFGKWTNYLKDHCSELIIVDLSAKCIEQCRERFKSSNHIEYIINDGKSLDSIPDNSIDFLFSFDSMVHVEIDIMEAYLSQLSLKLTQNGVAFIHHSNLGEYATYYSLIMKLPMARTLAKFHIVDTLFDSHRGTTVTAEKVKQTADKHNLKCISQEMINWHSKRLIDCFTFLSKNDCSLYNTNQPIRNNNFMKEVECSNNISKLYSKKLVEL